MSLFLDGLVWGAGFAVAALIVATGFLYLPDLAAWFISKVYIPGGDRTV